MGGGSVPCPALCLQCKEGVPGTLPQGPQRGGGTGDLVIRDG